MSLSSTAIEGSVEGSQRKHLSLHAERGWRNFSRIFWGTGFFPRGKVFFFGNSRGRCAIFFSGVADVVIRMDECYGMPDLESRGLKIAVDKHGERVDPIRNRVWRRPRKLRKCGVMWSTASRRCECSDSGDSSLSVREYFKWGFFDRPASHDKNVWFVGGGSGHGFKHGPAVGAYLAGQLLDGSEPEERFLFDKKKTIRHRTVY